jgi:glyoxylase-like metal-dependent hydrolase (beta-lactamase superfamily II)
MFQKRQHGLVTVFKMGRSVGKTTLYPVHAFLLNETLIDSGTRHVRHPFSAEMRQRRITTLINTHHHEDHVGNNRWLQDRFSLTILAHPSAIPFLEDPKKLNLRPYQRIVWGEPEPSMADPIGPAFDTGQFRLEVLPTPGHCPGHIALYEASRGGLFTGDLFCGMGFKYLRSDEDYPTILENLNRLMGLEFNTLFCSLLGVVTKGKAALRRKISAMEELQAKTLHLSRQGLSPRAIRNRLLGREGVMRWVTGGHYSKQNTIDSILTGAANKPCV